MLKNIIGGTILSVLLPTALASAASPGATYERINPLEYFKGDPPFRRIEYCSGANNQAPLFLYRPADANSEPVAVIVDGKQIASLESNTFTCMVLSPGEHTISSEMTEAGREKVVRLRKREPAYVRMQVGEGAFSKKVLPMEISHEAALGEIRTCRLVTP